MHFNGSKQHKIINSREILDYQQLEPCEVSFLEKIIMPELSKYTRHEQEIILNRFKGVVENRNNYASPFPIDKEYDRTIIKAEGVRKVSNSLDMTRQLVLGIISRKNEVRERSFELYQEEILDQIRACIKPERIFAHVNGHLEGEPNAQKTEAILDILSDKSITNNSRLDEIIVFLRNGLRNPDTITEYQSLVARLNKRTIDLSRSYGKHGCCAFWGTGEQNIEYQLDLSSRYHASVLYLADPEIGLLFDHVEYKNDLGLPVGVVIMASMLGKPAHSSSQKEERILLVDSTETYRPKYDTRFPDQPLREMKNDIWRRINYNALFKIAEDIGAEKIFYNPVFWNEGGNTFTNYFLKRAQNEGLDPKETIMHLRKEGGRKFIPPYYWDPFGFFLDCIIPKDSKHFCGEHAIKGSYDGEGTAKGWVIELAKKGVVEKAVEKVLHFLGIKGQNEHEQKVINLLREAGIKSKFSIRYNKIETPEGYPGAEVSIETGKSNLFKIGSPEVYVFCPNTRYKEVREGVTIENLYPEKDLGLAGIVITFNEESKKAEADRIAGILEKYVSSVQQQANGDKVIPVEVMSVKDFYVAGGYRGHFKRFAPPDFTTRLVNKMEKKNIRKEYLKEKTPDKIYQETDI